MSLALVLGVVAGLASLYLALSLAATWLQELIAALLKWRARTLAQAVRAMLDPGPARGDPRREIARAWSAEAGESVRKRLNESLFRALYRHPLVAALRGARDLPQYIPSRQFAAALLDLLARAGSEDSPAAAAIDRIKAGLASVGSAHTRGILLAIVESARMTECRAEEQVARVRDSVAAWFDGVMDHASGWYRSRAQAVAFALGAALAAAFNVDTIRVAAALWRDSLLAEAVRAQVQREGAAALDSLARLGLPVGWESGNIPQGAAAIALWAVGMLLTAVAVSQGSPFWFDVLNRVANLRLSGGKLRA